MSITALARGALLLATLLAGLPATPAAAQEATEADLKAAIIANMLLFVTWPQPLATLEPLTICHLDNSPVAAALDKLDGRNVKGRPLRVARTNVEQAGACHALYLSPDNPAALNRLLARQMPPVLLVSDNAGYLQRGTALNLELVGGRIVFDVNLRAAQRSGIGVSSKALHLARQVIE